MNIIDRYLLRQFIKTFVICYVSLTGLYVVFDAFANFEEFLRGAERHGGLLPLMGKYYAYRSVFFFDRTAGLLTLLSAMFTVTWIRRNNELTALMAAGVCRTRIVLPIVCAAVLIAGFSTANRELAIPQFRNELSQEPSDLAGAVSQPLQQSYDNTTGILFRGRATCAEGSRIDEPSFRLPRSMHDFGKQLAAQKAFYKPPQGNRPGGYLLTGVRQPKDLDNKPSLLIGNKAVIITPRDAPDWLEPGQCFLVSDVTFEQLSGSDNWRRFASTAQLITALHNPSLDYSADVRVAIHSRVVQPLLDITLLFLGLPLVLARENRNVFIAIGLCGLVVSLFVLVAMVFQYAGASSWLSPALAAWAPLLIFVPVAAGMTQSVWE